MHSLPSTHDSEVEFLRTEIHTGLTMSRLALETTQQSKMERNRTNARKAYEALLHFIPLTSLDADEAAEIKRGLSQLESELRLLGDKL